MNVSPLPVWLGALSMLAMAGGCASESEESVELHDERVDLAHVFDGAQPVEATFVLVNGRTGETARYNPTRAAERFLPASTFKIPHSLIALETGVVSDGDFLIGFDSTRIRDGFWTPEWSRDHTLRSAFQNSVYWYYQETARRIGAARMTEYLERFSYGNQSMGGRVDRFWLEGGLRISPDEQVQFIQRMYEGDLGVSDRSLAILKSIMVLEQGPDYTLSGKTGTFDLTPTRELAWLVGYVERAGDVWYFALNMEGEEVWERWGEPTARRTLVTEILAELGVLPESV